MLNAPAARPANHKPFLEMILDHNPCYLISVLCMLGGIYALDQTLAPAAGQLHKILLLLGTLNLYEALLIALAIILLITRPLLRDGRTLACLEVLFLADATHLNAEALFTDPFYGSILNAIILIGALVKTVLLFRQLNINFTAVRFATIGFSLTLLYTMPLMFHLLDHHGVGALPPYLLWWVIALIPMLHHLLSRGLPPVGSPKEPRTVLGLFLAIPYLSLIAHLGFFHWIYDAPFFFANLTPILLGLIIPFLRSTTFQRLGSTDRALLRLLLPAIAMAFSLGNPQELTLHLTPTFALSPFELSLAAAVIGCTYAFADLLVLPVLAIGVLGLLVRIFGPSPATVLNAAQVVWVHLWNAASKAAAWLWATTVPSTPAAWGILSVVAAFALLLMGGIISYCRKSPQIAEQVPATT